MTLRTATCCGVEASQLLITPSQDRRRSWENRDLSLYSVLGWTHLSFVESLQLLLFGFSSGSSLNSPGDFGVQLFILILSSPLEQGLLHTQTRRLLCLDQVSHHLRGTRGLSVRVLNRDLQRASLKQQTSQEVRQWLWWLDLCYEP